MDRYQKSSNTLALLFLDFCKAFDLVDHDTLLAKLHAIGVQGQFYATIRSYLSDHYQCVRVGSTWSTLLPVTTGVPQGLILAPTLFLIFINDLLTLPLNSKVHAYADDTTFYRSNKNPLLLQCQINNDFFLIQKWCTQSKMSVNTSKSHYLIVNPKPVFSFSFLFQGTALLERSVTKLLGFTITNDLSWKEHICDIFKKVLKNLRLLFHILHLLDFRTYILC